MLLALALLLLVNDYRAGYDLPPLLPSAHLTEAAGWLSHDPDRFCHTDSLGRGVYERAQDFGFSGRVGENLAFGSTRPTSIFKAWRDSPGHNANLLDSEFTVIGIGHYGRFWVADFGGCRSCRVYSQWRW